MAPWSRPGDADVMVGRGTQAGDQPLPSMKEKRMTVRIQYAELEYEPYASLEDPDEPDWAPYVRLAECSNHPGVLEPVTGHKIIPTGPGDTCWVGTFACGAIVVEDVF